MNECKTVRSMTGYGKASLEQGALLLEVEVKSVNSRFLDLCFKLPRTYLSFETKLRELISARLQRGRVELTVVRTPLRQESCGISLNRALFDAYFQVCQSLAKELKCFDGALKAEFV
ncbi:MAG: hypothetical protein GX589_03650, partial [Deltaproteobacteria bacterium]|nr:hypothetical protein [Deltaproteobacteria bacterium]